MKFGIATVVAMAVSAVAATASAPASVAKVIPFVASYSGTAVVKVTETDKNIYDVSASGSGTGTLVGKSKIAGTGTADTSQQPCVPFTGPGTIVGSNGTKVYFTVSTGSQGCGDEPGQIFSIVGKAKVTKATGKLAKARGTLKFTGVYDRGQGTFSIKFKGSLTR